ncbi:hypothetical protein GGR56DRAFT_675970 [Xylariaceae sp. FL0804]|nr:hypothetical protein GGR56DRAFT_675970 [Xylariaceae sp. FL0804]
MLGTHAAITTAQPSSSMFVDDEAQHNSQGAAAEVIIIEEQQPIARAEEPVRQPRGPPEAVPERFASFIPCVWLRGPPDPPHYDMGGPRGSAASAAAPPLKPTRQTSSGRRQTPFGGRGGQVAPNDRAAPLASTTVLLLQDEGGIARSAGDRAVSITMTKTIQVIDLDQGGARAPPPAGSSLRRALASSTVSGGRLALTKVPLNPLPALPWNTTKKQDAQLGMGAVRPGYRLAELTGKGSFGQTPIPRRGTPLHQLRRAIPLSGMATHLSPAVAASTTAANTPWSTRGRISAEAKVVSARQTLGELAREKGRGSYAHGDRPFHTGPDGHSAQQPPKLHQGIQQSMAPPPSIHKITVSFVGTVEDPRRAGAEARAMAAPRRATSHTGPPRVLLA